MQKIRHQEENVHPLFDEIENFYCMTSQKSVANTNSLIQPIYDYSFEYLHGFFEEYGEVEYRVDFVDRNYSKLNSLGDEKDLILLFSGGKDSTAAALGYKELGYNVYLYHLLGINKQYPDEWKRAKQIADYLNLPIYFDKIELSGKLDYPEHPMKNMLIATRALNWGIKNNITTQLACGNYKTGHLEKASFFISSGDTVEMWDLYNYIIQTIIPNFEMKIDLTNSTETLNILSKDFKLFGLAQSCMGAYRFREWNKKRIEDKYNIKLLPNRCGSCWKDAVEYIYLVDNSDEYEYNEEYYKYCLNILKKNAKNEHNVVFNSIIELWESYFSYNIENSKYKDILNYK